MIGAWLSRGVRLAQAHTALVNLLLPMTLALAVCGAGVGWLHEHDQRIRNDEHSARDLRIAKEQTVQWQSLWTSASERVTKDGTTVTVTRDRYHTIRDTQIVTPVTHADTAQALNELPIFVRTADSAIAACTQYQTSCTEYRRMTDSLVASLHNEVGQLERAKILKPPRWTVEGEALYDPIGTGAEVSVQASLRVVSRVALVARASQWSSDRPRLGLGIRIEH